MRASRDQPCGDAQERCPLSPSHLDDLFCDLCGAPMEPREFSQAVRDATNMDICCACLERHTENACASSH